MSFCLLQEKNSSECYVGFVFLVHIILRNFCMQIMDTLLTLLPLIISCFPPKLLVLLCFYVATNCSIHRPQIMLRNVVLTNLFNNDCSMGILSLKEPEQKAVVSHQRKFKVEFTYSYGRTGYLT
jgi:hypothetical protein